MELDPFDYDELTKNVNELLDDEYGAREDDFDFLTDDAGLPDDPGHYRNAANGYGMDDGQDPDFDEEAAAMRYDPQTNAGAAIHAYNTDYATRAARKANRRNPPAQRPDRNDAARQQPRRKSADRDATQRLPRQRSVDRSGDTPRQPPRRSADRQEVLDRIDRRPPRREPPRRTPRPAPEQEIPPVQPPVKKKKHGFLKFLLVLILLLALTIAALWIFARQPDGDSLGVHRDGCSAILLAGTDAEGARTDTMMLLYVDRNAGELNLLSLPRDTYTSMDTDVPKLNSVYSLAGRGREGMERLMDYTQECIGYRPDGYILVDLKCFEHLVNIMGGVRYDVPCDMQYDDPAQDLHIDLQAGEQKLNGKKAMWLVRYRSGYANADLGRVEVQRDFMHAALKQWTSPARIWRSPAAAALLLANTTSDLNVLELAWIAKAVKQVGTEDMHNDTLPGEPAYIDGGSYYVLWPETTANLVNEDYNPYREEVSPWDVFSPFYNS